MVEHTGPVEEDFKPAPAAEGSGRIISFGLKRKEAPKLVKPAEVVTSVQNDSDEEREAEEEARQAKRRKLESFVNGRAPVDDDDKAVQVVIPLTRENDWRVTKLLEKEKEGTITEEERARLAILTENNTIKTEGEQGANEGGAKKVINIGGEDVTVSEDADYGKIPIAQFGLAILRGCGWKDGDGIGRVPKKVPLTVNAQRPKGLGLGATPANPQKKAGKSDKGEDLSGEITKDSLVRIVCGRNNGMYGKVESRDDDNNSLYVRLALGGQSVKVSLYAAQRVSKKEYDKDAKCLNKGAYDSEKAKIEKKRADIEKDVRRRERGDRDDVIVLDDAKEGSSREPEELWARPELVVRFIDKDYDKGKLYKEKLRVVDVASRRNISLEDDYGQIFYNLRQSWMETVIPRNEGDRIMVVRGRYTGSPAVMERKDKKRDRVVARLLSNNKMVDLDFDDVCLFRPKYEEDYD